MVKYGTHVPSSTNLVQGHNKQIKKGTQFTKTCFIDFSLEGREEDSEGN